MKQSDKQTELNFTPKSFTVHFDYLSDLSASHSLCLTAELHNARLHVLSSFKFFFLLKPVSSARDIDSVYLLSVLLIKTFNQSLLSLKNTSSPSFSTHSC